MWSAMVVLKIDDNIIEKGHSLYSVRQWLFAIGAETLFE